MENILLCLENIIQLNRKKRLYGKTEDLTAPKLEGRCEKPKILEREHELIQVFEKLMKSHHMENKVLFRTKQKPALLAVFSMSSLVMDVSVNESPRLLMDGKNIDVTPLLYLKTPESICY